MRKSRGTGNIFRICPSPTEAARASQHAEVRERLPQPSWPAPKGDSPLAAGPMPRYVCRINTSPLTHRRRRADYHRKKLAVDPEYRDVCRDSPRKWRSRNPDYWKQYRQKNPRSAERNRQPTATPRPQASAPQSCKQHLSSGFKAFRRTGLARRARRGGSCKQQLSSGASLGNRSTSTPPGSPAAILQTTSCWRSRRSCRITEKGDARHGTD